MKTILLPPKAVYSGPLILINSRYPYRPSGRPRALRKLSRSREGRPAVVLEEKAATQLLRLLTAIGGRRQIRPVSGWRSEREQTFIYEESLKENGADFTAIYVAKPGHSEHESGFAIDMAIEKPEIDFIRPDFPHHGIAQTFREQAATFGFIERYPAGKEEITGIASEPWHFRYVGKPHAAIMKELALTLEEYHLLLKEYPVGRKPFLYRRGSRRFTLSYQAAAGPKEAVAIAVDDRRPFQISGNNIDGFILTTAREGLSL